MADRISSERRSWNMPYIRSKGTGLEADLRSLIKRWSRNFGPVVTALRQKKFDETTMRDARKSSELIKRGWRVVTIWECELNSDPIRLVEGLCNQPKAARNG